jgi:hypothetical protein
MEKFNPTHEEFYNLMQQLYPDQSSRVIAEIRSAKMEFFIQNQKQEEEKDE